MGGQTGSRHIVSRRSFLQGIGWAPVLFLPGEIRALPFVIGSSPCPEPRSGSPFPNFGFRPHYPARPSLDDRLRHVTPGGDGYLHEKDASEIARRLAEWGQELKAQPREIRDVAQFLDDSIVANSAVPSEERVVRSQYGVAVLRRQFGSA